MVIAQLVGEPLVLSLERIAELTDRQMTDLYHHPRDREGNLKRRPRAAKELTEEQAAAQALAVAVAMGCSEAEIEKLKRKIKERKCVKTDRCTP